jgi:hypothetical protein
MGTVYGLGGSALTNDQRLTFVQKSNTEGAAKYIQPQWIGVRENMSSLT